MNIRKLGIWVLLVMIGSMYSVKIAGQEKSGKSEADKIIERLHPVPEKSKDRFIAGIKLLPGYKGTHAADFELNEYGEIKKKGGLKFTYEKGFNGGQAVKVEKKDEYLYYSEQIVKGCVIKCALTKEKVYMISVSLNPNYPHHAANFRTKVEKPEDASDMLVMALTLLEAE